MISDSPYTGKMIIKWQDWEAVHAPDHTNYQPTDAQKFAT